MVTRLPDPYGNCQDPNDVDKMHNAYAEQFLVDYTAAVSTRILFADSIGNYSDQTICKLELRPESGLFMKVTHAVDLLQGNNDKFVYKQMNTVRT